MSTEDTVLVFDVGTDILRAGFAGVEPVMHTPSYSVRDGVRMRTYDRGTVVDWSAAEALWEKTFISLGVVPDQHPVLVVVPTLESPSTLKRLSEMLFETMGVPSLCFGDSAVLSACAAGTQTGIVLESGAGLSTASAIVNGQVVRDTVVSTKLGGRDITALLGKYLNRNHSEELSHIKHQSGYVSPNPLLEPERYEEALLPDGSSVRLSGQQYRCAEILFHPRQLLPSAGPSQQGIHEIVATSCSRYQGDKASLYGNILLSGSNTILKGLPSRLADEVSSLIEPGYDVGVGYCCNQPGIAAWKGGSIMALSAPLPWRRRGEFMQAKKVGAPAPDKDVMKHVTEAQQLTNQLQQLELSVMEKTLTKEKESRQEAERETERLRDTVTGLNERLHATVVEKGDWEVRITRLLQRYDPQCVPAVSSLLRLEKFHLHPEMLFAELTAMYGPEVSPRMSPERTAHREVTPLPPNPMHTLDELRRRTPRRMEVKKLIVREHQPPGMNLVSLPGLYGGHDVVVVASVDLGGPACDAGVHEGDILLEINGTEIDSSAALERARSDFYFKMRLRGMPGTTGTLTLTVDTYDKLAAFKDSIKQRQIAASAELAVLQLRRPAPVLGEQRDICYRGTQPATLWPTKPGGVSGGGDKPDKKDDKAASPDGKKKKKKGDKKEAASPKKKKKPEKE